MSFQPGRGRGRETRKPRGEPIVGGAMNRPTRRPSGEGEERHVAFAHRPEVAPDMRPSNYKQGQHESTLRPPRNRSPGGQAETQILSPLRLSPSRHREGTLADSDTILARWRDDDQLGKQETLDNSQGWSTSKGPKVHFQRPVERHQRTSEDDDSEKGGSVSSSDSSLGGSLTIVEKDESRFEDRNHALSHSFEMIEHGDARSGDEDEYVHVSRGSPRVGAFEREKFSGKA